MAAAAAAAASSGPNTAAAALIFSLFASPPTKINRVKASASAALAPAMASAAYLCPAMRVPNAPNCREPVTTSSTFNVGSKFFASSLTRAIPAPVVRPLAAPGNWWVLVFVVPFHPFPAGGAQVKKLIVHPIIAIAVDLGGDNALLPLSVNKMVQLLGYFRDATIVLLI